MQRGETITEATEREVLEETGLIVVCKTLLMVETAGGLWIRFVLTGDIIGGSLKTPAQADKESLQAKWIGDLNELTLRAPDIIHLIDRTRYEIFYSNKNITNIFNYSLCPIQNNCISVILCKLSKLMAIENII